MGILFLRNNITEMSSFHASNLDLKLVKTRLSGSPCKSNKVVFVHTSHRFVLRGYVDVNFNERRMKYEEPSMIKLIGFEIRK